MWARTRAALCAVMFAIAYLFVGVVVALAADKGAPSFLDPPKETNGWNRTTFYIGAAGGYDTTVIRAEDFRLGDGNLLAGPFVGFNYRAADRLVVGLEADYLFSRVSGHVSDGLISLQASTDYLASIRGRVGIPFGPALLYTTAGVAFTDLKVTASGPLSERDKETLVGAAFGAGLEAELTNTLFARVEAIHYWFPDKTMSFSIGDIKTEHEQTTVRIAVGFKLN